MISIYFCTPARDLGYHDNRRLILSLTELILLTNFYIRGELAAVYYVNFSAM